MRDDDFESMGTVFTATARQLMRRIELHNLRGWRHHALGMLQAELSNDVRVHVWHPKLRDPFGRLFYENPYRAVHDHRFTITSCVIAGAIVDIPFTVVIDGPNVHGYAEARDPITRGLEYVVQDVYEIAHAKVQDQAAKDGKLAEKVGRAFVRQQGERRFKTGDVYRIERREFHTSSPQELAVTLIHRSDFDDRPARVLGGAESAIVPYSLDMLILRNWVLDQAQDLIVETLRKFT